MRKSVSLPKNTTMEDVVEVIKIERRYIKDTKYDYISHEEINITWCDEPCFSQRRNISYNPHSSETKVNEFINWLNSSNEAHKTSNNARYIGRNGGEFLHLVSKSGFKAFNLKQKFFYFLIKHIFLKRKTAATDKV